MAEGMQIGGRLAVEVLHSELALVEWLCGRARALALYEEVAQRALRRLQEQSHRDASEPRPPPEAPCAARRGGRSSRKRGGGSIGGAIGGGHQQRSRPY